MRLYAKLVLLVVTFLSLTWLSGESGRGRVWEMSFAARCQAAKVLGDQQMEDRLVAEYQVVLRKTLELQVREFAADKDAPAPRICVAARR